MFSKVVAPENTTSGTVRNRSIRPTSFTVLSCCCGLFILIIIACLIVFTVVPIVLPTKGNQTRYQTQSDLLILIYDLPHDASILPENLTYTIGDLPSDKFSILETLLQKKLNETGVTKKTIISVAGARITNTAGSSPSSIAGHQIGSAAIIDNNATTITVYQTQKERRHSAAQLNISLVLRYALECTKKCQHNLKESIFARKFKSLQFTFHTFQTLLTKEKSTTTITTVKSTLFSSIMIPFSVSTPTSCGVSKVPLSHSASSLIMARSYEAESPLNTFISPNDSKIEPCSFCSGGQKVSHIGLTSNLVFEQINSHSGGSTFIVFYYTTDRIRSAQITVNNRIPAINVTFPSTATIQTLGLLPLTLDLCQGINSIQISNSKEFAPDFDRIVVY